MSEIARPFSDIRQDDIARNRDAYRQAIYFAAEWARDSMGKERIDSYMESKSYLDKARKLGVVAVGSMIRKFMPRFNAEARLMGCVVDELRPSVLSIGAEATVLREGDEVVKVLTGKSRMPEQLAPVIDRRYKAFKGFLGRHAVDTEFDIRTMQVFRNSPPMKYVCATQPYLNITEQYALEDDSYLGQSSFRVLEALSVTSRLQQLHDSHGLLYDTAKPGNVVAVNSNGLSDTFVMPDVAIASMEDPHDFVGLNSFGVWHSKIYLNALLAHVYRVKQLRT